MNGAGSTATETLALIIVLEHLRTTNKPQLKDQSVLLRYNAVTQYLRCDGIWR